MLSKMTKIRSGSLRLRYVVLPLAIPIALFNPVVASAVQGSSHAGGPVTYVNLAKATSRSNNWTDYSVEFMLRQSSASIINADDTALAQTTGCHDCGAIAIAFQVVFAQSPAAVNADNTAEAASTFCVRCSTLAEAYQIVDISNTQPRLTREQLAGLRHAQRALEALRNARLSTDQIQNEVAELASQVVALLQGSSAAPPSSDQPAVSPAVNGSANLAPLTEISQPDVELFYKIQSA